MRSATQHCQTPSGFLGHPREAADMAVQAVALAEQRGTPINLTVIGGGPGEDEMKELAAAKCPGRVHFCGPVHDHAALASIFASAAVTVVPDYGGLSIPHSLIHGVPVVANDDPPANGPDYEYLYPETNGSVFPRGDVEAFTDQVLRWAYDEAMSPERKQAIEDRAREDASPVLGAQRIFAAIDECLTRKD
ncbi:MAG: glycosyltransferase family 4 protein [Acidimicrobiales bacterium]